MNQKSFDLEERTAKFWENVIDLCKKVKINNITSPLINQLIRSATSVGANYTEANNASSRRDFRNKIFICKKEAQETKYWMRMLAKADNSLNLFDLPKECQELVLIFQKIVSSIDK